MSCVYYIYIYIQYKFYDVILCSIVSYYTMVYYITSYCITLHSIILYYVILTHIYIYCISLLYSISSWYIIHIHSQNPRWTHAAEAAGKSATSWGSEKQRIDIGFQVFNLSNYPLLLSYDENNIFLEIFVESVSRILFAYWHITGLIFQSQLGWVGEIIQNPWVF